MVNFGRCTTPTESDLFIHNRRVLYSRISNSTVYAGWLEACAGFSFGESSVVPINFPTAVK